MSLTAGIALLGVCAVPAHAETGAHDPARTPQHACADARERCEGTIDVPLDWADPDSETISVAFAWQPPTDPGGSPGTPIMAHMGGPSASLGKERETPVRKAFGPLLNDRGLLMADLRGTGASSPAACDGLDMAEPDSAAACAEQLGGTAPYYATDQAAYDYEAVRAALGLDTVTFWGNSYGTSLGAAYAARFGAHLDAVYLDSVIGTSKKGYADSLANHSATGSAAEVFEAVCADSAACRDGAADFPERLAGAVGDLRGTDTAKPDLWALARLSAQAEYPKIGRELNAALKAQQDGDAAPLRRLIDAVLAVVPEPGPDDPPLTALPPEAAATVAFNCNDAQFGYDRSAQREQRETQLAGFLDQRRPYAPFTAAEALSDYGDWEHMCVGWPNPRESAPVPPGARFPDIPTLIVNGAHDQNTVPANAAELAGRFPDARLVLHPYDSHASWGERDGRGGQCPRDLMREFLADPAGFERTEGCDSRTYSALGSYPRTAERLPAAEGVRAGDARTVSVALATAADAVVRAVPGNGPATEEWPGVRGGSATYGADNGPITLNGDRFVEDAAVSGKVTIDPGDGYRARAEVTVDGDKADPRKVTLSWDALNTRAGTPVTGTVDGEKIRGTVPGF